MLKGMLHIRKTILSMIFWCMVMKMSMFMLAIISIFKTRAIRKYYLVIWLKGYQKVPEGADYGRGIVLFKNKGLSDNIALYQYKECLGGKLDVEENGYFMDRNSS